LTLGRIEKNRKKLFEVYKIGYETAKRNYEKLKEYLEK
jgi:phospholipase, patatin family